jgi:hypothetical protein
MTLKFLTLFSFTFLLLSVSCTPVMAAKKRVWSAVPQTVSTGTPSISAKITGWKQYFDLTFRGTTATINGFTYELTFTGNNLEQGVYGTVNLSEGNVTRSLYLGTCSHGVCTPYKNISNLHLTITYQTKAGATITKKYKVKY